jgi:hypothetical protein
LRASPTIETPRAAASAGEKAPAITPTTHSGGPVRTMSGRSSDRSARHQQCRGSLLSVDDHIDQGHRLTSAATRSG